MPAAVKIHAERFVEANGLRLCCQSFGAPDAPAMLLICGLGAQMIEWEDELCIDLAARGFHVVRFDNRDCGASSRMDGRGAEYRLIDMAADAVGVLDALNVAAAHVVGISMGGMIAQEVALHFPDRVRSLTSVMSMMGEPDAPGPTPEALALLTAPPSATPAAFRRRFAEAQALFRPYGFPRDEARDAARVERHLARGLCPEGTARQLAAVQASPSRKAGLAALRKPVLVIHGSDDPLIPLAAGEATAAAVPGARLVVLEHVGHGLPIECWLHVVDAIEETAKAA